jgi:hypothetical protein
MMSNKVKDWAEEYSLSFFVEPLMGLKSYAFRRSFGGIAIYVRGKNVCFVCEDAETKAYKEKSSSLPLWYGLLFPTDYAHHESLLQEWPSLVQHPVLKKWVYLQMSVLDFEEVAKAIVLAIKKGDERFGVEPSKNKKRAVQRGDKKVRKRKTSSNR